MADPYKILGITLESSPEEIKSAYRKCVKLYHPDVNKSLDAKAKFQEVQEAYEQVTKNKTAPGGSWEYVEYTWTTFGTASIYSAGPTFTIRITS